MKFNKWKTKYKIFTKLFKVWKLEEDISILLKNSKNIMNRKNNFNLKKKDLRN